MGKKKSSKVEDDCDIETSPSQETSDLQTEDTDKILEADKVKNAKAAKKGKKKKKGNDSDDDLEDLLAELESEYTGVPVKPKELPVNTENNTKTLDKPAEPAKTIVNGDATIRKDEVQDIGGTDAEKKDDGKKKKGTQKEKEDKGKANKKDATQKKEVNKNKPQKESQQKESKNKDTSNKENKTVNENKIEAKKEKETKPEVTKEDEKKDEEEVKEESGSKKKDKKKKKGKEEEEDKSKKSKPNKKMLELMKKMLAEKKEEDERLEKEEDERILLEDERIKEEEEARRIEEERKERVKQKQKERLKRLKEEGKLLTPKQKLEQARAKAMLEHLKAQGIEIGGTGEKSSGPPKYDKRHKKKKLDLSTQEGEKEAASPEPHETVVAPEKKVSESDGIADAWDQSDEEDDSQTLSASTDVDVEGQKSRGSKDAGDTDESGSEDDSDDDHVELNKREKAIARIEQRKLANEKNIDSAHLRAPVVCVLGHVDHGKTKILDKLRKTNVQDGEVGGITQQIGATNVPGSAIEAQTRMVKDFSMKALSFPGLLIIDTPGHESFSNLRTRGSSLCDIAILVVDITQGLEPQTIESINLLKNKKTPFVVALNKVDRVFEWESHPNEDMADVLKKQNEACRNDFDRRKTEILTALNEQGLNAALFWENPDARSYVSLIPTSAISGDGMGNLMSLICTMCQTRLSKRLLFSEELQCTVLEVKNIQGHGVTIDVILVNGRLKEGDTIIVAGTEGPIVTQIRSLLLPKPCREIRVKGQYDEFKEVQAAQGVKIAAKELEKAIAGLNLQVAGHEDEIDYLKEEVDREFKSIMRSMKVKDRGVYVQASTLGALEALLEFFKVNKVPYCGIRVGPVVKRDVMRAAAMLEHEPMYAVILAFDVKVERDAQDLADREGVKIFSEETIYHLGDRYVEYIKDYKKRKQDENKHIAVFPCRLKIIPTAIFNKRDPIVLGVTVDSGVIRIGTALCVPTKEFVDIGIVTSLEFDHKNVEIAKKGVDICIKIEPVPGHTPKLFGRHFDETDQLVSKISRESINACKEFFRDDLTKTDWKLMADLKKEFGIL